MSCDWCYKVLLDADRLLEYDFITEPMYNMTKKKPLALFSVLSFNFFVPGPCELQL